MADQTDDCKYFDISLLFIKSLCLSAQTSRNSALRVCIYAFLLAHPDFNHSTNNQTGSSESNDALQISLVTPHAGSAKTVHTFNPKMTYSIFGDEERIFGYKGLKINLRFSVSDMRPNLQVSHSKKFQAVGETEATDIKVMLEPFLPKSMDLLKHRGYH